MKEIIEYLRDMDESVQSMKDNISDLIDIANLPCQQKEVSDLIISSCQMIDRKIGSYDITNKRIKSLFQRIELEKIIWIAVAVNYLFIILGFGFDTNIRICGRFKESN